MTAIKILEASSGSSLEFPSIDGKMTFKLVITGSPSGTIKAFIDGNDSTMRGVYLKISGLTAYGGGAKLQAKTSHADDSFTDAGRTFDADFAGIFNAVNIL